jgi:hypothetical protein
MSSVCSVLVHGFEVKLHLKSELLVLSRLQKAFSIHLAWQGQGPVIPQDLATFNTLLQFQGLN